MKERAQPDSGKIQKSLPLQMSFWMLKKKIMSLILIIYKMSKISILSMSSSKKIKPKRTVHKIKFENELYIFNILI